MLVLLHDNWPGVQATLDSVAASSVPVHGVVVVDNGRSEVDRRALIAANPEITVVDARGNLGYAGGMNLGARLPVARASRRMLMLTHDVVLHADCIRYLEAALDGGAAVAGPLLGRRDAPDVLWSAGGVLDLRSGAVRHRAAGALVHSEASEVPYPVDWVDGACTLVDGATFRQAGGFAEDFFLYWEEVDFQLRVRALGERVVVAPKALAWQSPGMAPPYLDARNGSLVLARHGSRVAVARFVLLQLRGGLAAASHGQWWQLRARSAGLRDAALHRLSQRWLLRRPG